MYAESGAGASCNPAIKSPAALVLSAANINKGENMKTLYLAAAVAAVFTTTAQADTKKPVSKWTCEEFLAVEDQFQPKVIYWSSAQGKGGKPSGFVDIEGAEKVVPMVIDDCKKAPQESYWSKLKAAWKKVEADAKALEKKM